MAVDLPSGTKFTSQWNKPSTELGEDATRIFVGETVWTRTIDVGVLDEVEIPLSVSFMACDARMCLPLKKIEHILKFNRK